jgi:predicted methyltransferase
MKIDPSIPMRQLTFAATILSLTVSWAAAQDKSVKPGINDPFKDPNLNLQEWISRFERESRETYDKRREIIAACQLRPGMTVADVGAGTGLFTRLFAAEVGDNGTVYAVDIAPKFLDYINESAKKAGLKNIKTVLGTDMSAELPRGAIDLVFICDTYHHFEYPERMLKSIHEALKPGGRMVVVDFIREEGKSRPWILDHVRAGQALVEKEIQTAGFKKVGEVKDLLQENYLITFEKPAVSTAPSRNGSDK